MQLVETDEMVLVVPESVTTRLSLQPGFNLWPADLGWRDVLQGATFEPRNKMEVDESFRQLIPYVVFKYGDKFYSYTRLKGQGEGRLDGKQSLGVGGHINPEDESEDIAETYIKGLQRELSEEVSLVAPVIGHRLLGLLNDTDTPVGRVHLGLLHLIEVLSDGVTAVGHAMRDEGFQKIEDFNQGKFEAWSQFAIELFKSGKDLAAVGTVFEIGHSIPE